MYAYHALVRIDRTTGRTAGTVRDGLTMDEAADLRRTLVAAPGYDEATTGYRTVTMPLAAQASAVEPDAETAALATIHAFERSFSTGEHRERGNPNALAGRDLTRAAIEMLRVAGLDRPTRDELSCSYGYAYVVGLLPREWEGRVTAEAMLGAVCDGLLAYAATQRTLLDVPAGMLPPVYASGDSQPVAVEDVTLTPCEPCAVCAAPLRPADVADHVATYYRAADNPLKGLDHYLGFHVPGRGIDPRPVCAACADTLADEPPCEHETTHEMERRCDDCGGDGYTETDDYDAERGPVLHRTFCQTCEGTGEAVVFECDNCAEVVGEATAHSTAGR